VEPGEAELVAVIAAALKQHRRPSRA
jgi:Na+-transporting methylmalonyl-CoA/oxaloacetate decarboxylase gamma subunit